MKTFETEKGHIPEGATHYINQTSYTYFSWGKYVDNKLHLMLSGESEWTSVSAGIFEGGVKPIPQTKDAEWVNGDKCRYANDIEHEYIYIGEHPHGDGHYVFSEETGITYIANGYLLELESEADKLEREELEAGYDLCCTYNENDFGSANEFKLHHPTLCDKWLAIVRKTGYRKGE